MEPLMHFAIPFAVASLLGLRLRWAFLSGVVGLIPDFDTLFFIHRSVSHSILPALALLIPLVVLKGSRVKYLLQITSLGWTAHVILDFVGGSTPILWPLLDKSYKLIFESSLHVGSSPATSVTFRILEETYDYGVFATFDAPLFTAEGLVISLTLIALAFAIGYIRMRPLVKR